MSSLHEALSLDIHKNKPTGGKVNQIVLRSHQEKTDGPVGADFFARKELEHKQAQAMRRAEGGVCGGYRDRQEVVYKEGRDDTHDDLDEFGRKRRKEVQGLTKAARAQAALERLKQKATGSSSKRRSRSRSPAADRQENAKKSS
mmetsp:Transcript_18291/g.50163  ORF Transcript_18291/g.50163 Transcript_18291/m.50163 type:complete len:144 (-) Transcript_18291:142-573(-)